MGLQTEFDIFKALAVYLFVFKDNGVIFYSKGTGYGLFLMCFFFNQNTSTSVGQLLLMSNIVLKWLTDARHQLHQRRVPNNYVNQKTNSVYNPFRFPAVYFIFFSTLSTIVKSQKNRLSHIFFTLWQFKIENTEMRKSCWCCIPLPWMNWDVKEFAKLKLWIVPETPVNHWRQLKSAVQFVLHGTYTILG